MPIAFTNWRNSMHSMANYPRVNGSLRSDWLISEVLGSGRQGCNIAGESPVVSVARVGHVAMPQFV